MKVGKMPAPPGNSGSPVVPGCGSAKGIAGAEACATYVRKRGRMRHPDIRMQDACPTHVCERGLLLHLYITGEPPTPPRPEAKVSCIVNEAVDHKQNKCNFYQLSFQY